MVRITNHDGRLTEADLRRLADERRLIDLLFARLAEDTEQLQPEIAALGKARFFCEAARRIDRMMEARIPLATLENRLHALSRDYKLPEDSPRFLLLETAVRALAADALRTVAERISTGYIVPPLGADERLRTWAGVLEAADLEEEPSYAEAARTLRDAADRLPKMRRFA